MIASQSENISTLRQFLFANRVLTAATIISAAVTIMRRDWHIVPLLAWLVATLVFVIFQVPLWPRHVIVLVPPLIAILVLGLKGLPGIPTRRPVAWEQRGALLVGLLALAVVAWSAQHDYRYHRDMVRWGSNPADQRMAQLAADLERVTTPDQWILADAQFAAAFAGRDTPPWLVDTSFTRISSGYLTSQELIQAGTDARVRAVVFSTDHLALAQVGDFHSWVAQHFRLQRKYDDGIELWIR